MYLATADTQLHKVTSCPLGRTPAQPELALGPSSAPCAMLLPELLSERGAQKRPLMERPFINQIWT
ncbi:hypothetical protein AH4AK4_2465 [Aeromonas hydrophila 4AK4]|nr:hypothetical protein AH4AK4_2465 [Aeromonas hydrophila 4AK4]